MSLQRRVRELLDRLDARTSAYARHLPSGAGIAVRADEPVDTLSAIKIPVLVLAFRDVEAGKLDLEGRRVVGPQDLRNGTGVLKNFEPGLQPTWGDLLTQMIITSDNTATDIVVDRVGFERVNDLLGELGYTGTRLQHTLAGYFRRRWELLDPANASLSNAEASARGNLSLAVQGGAAPGSRPGPGASEGLRRKATAIR
jgi:beta-lactamase class A